MILNTLGCSSMILHINFNNMTSVWNYFNRQFNKYNYINIFWLKQVFQYFPVICFDTETKSLNCLLHLKQFKAGFHSIAI